MLPTAIDLARLMDLRDRRGAATVGRGASAGLPIRFSRRLMLGSMNWDVKPGDFLTFENAGLLRNRVSLKQDHFPANV